MASNLLHSPQPVSTPPRPRDVQIVEVGPQTTVMRSRMWERLKFEVEYGRRRGTTANSYLVCGDRVALIDPPGESFTKIFLEELQPYLEQTRPDTIILGHVNPNRMATLAVLMERLPEVTIVCSRPAAQALKTTFPDWESRIQPVCPPQTSLDLGQGHHLQLFTVPTPRWPDGLCTYDPATQTLFSDKLFGAHVCGDQVFDQNWRQLEVDRRYYFDCLHAAQAKQVAAALEQIAPLSVQCFAPGHGPLVRYSLSRLHHDYRQWCQQQAQQTLRVALLYASAYGNTAILADAIAQGLMQSEVAVESINCELADPTELAQSIAASDGFIIGSPTLAGHAPVQVQTALGIVLASSVKTKLAGVFGSYGWSGEAIDWIEGKLRDSSFRLGFETIRVRFSPDQPTLEACQQAGAEFAQQLRKQKKQRTPRQAVTETQTDRTEQAVGRVVGSICVVTTRQGDSHSGMLTAWVSQATFDPPGLMLAIAAEHYAESLIQPGAQFVVNILKEGRTVRRHFSYQPRPGDDPFSQVAHRTAANGCLMLEDALAYLECTVQSWIRCGDHWLVYAAVNQGDLLETSGVTAIQHRKSGSQY
ncbi:diflavin flavoprotein [Romeria aff. gracilis LEGE 07310]|uniref:Diflavin flavoprotein n=1 Tax=Vasconcelosia minhoensis LEGE 07310 TaxID=915328 RepID=A0A8J7AKZ4_9CYAN|nr:diflavin flavoprotein [Romeria gracilis]MBE9077010.1 diflavin flavoprotein [Romeria aff. gracilis LEGE 07310]